jgi:hypothetical protein
MILDRPPGGLCTLTEVFTSVGWLLSLKGTLLVVGWVVVVVVFLEVVVEGAVVLVVVFVGGGFSHPREKLLLPPGVWRTLTDVVPVECFEKSI